jgi:hypothetical protein
VLIPNSQTTPRVKGGRLNVIGSLVRRTDIPLVLLSLFPRPILLVPSRLQHAERRARQPAQQACIPTKQFCHFLQAFNR